MTMTLHSLGWWRVLAMEAADDGGADADNTRTVDNTGPVVADILWRCKFPTLVVRQDCTRAVA